MEFQMGVIILLGGFVALVLFKIFDFVEIKNNKFRSRHFFIFYHLAALIFSAITYTTAMILGVISLDSKDWILLMVYMLFAMFGFSNFISYVERFAYCLPK